MAPLFAAFLFIGLNNAIECDDRFKATKTVGQCTRSIDWESKFKNENWPDGCQGYSKDVVDWDCKLIQKDKKLISNDVRHVTGLKTIPTTVTCDCHLIFVSYFVEAAYRYFTEKQQSVQGISSLFSTKTDSSVPEKISWAYDYPVVLFKCPNDEGDVTRIRQLFKKKEFEPLPYEAIMGSDVQIIKKGDEIKNYIYGGTKGLTQFGVYQAQTIGKETKIKKMYELIEGPFHTLADLADSLGQSEHPKGIIYWLECSEALPREDSPKISSIQLHTMAGFNQEDLKKRKEKWKQFNDHLEPQKAMIENEDLYFGYDEHDDEYTVNRLKQTANELQQRLRQRKRRRKTYQVDY